MARDAVSRAASRRPACGAPRRWTGCCPCSTCAGSPPTISARPWRRCSGRSRRVVDHEHGEADRRVGSRVPCRSRSAVSRTVTTCPSCFLPTPSRKPRDDFKPDCLKSRHPLQCVCHVPERDLTCDKPRRVELSARDERQKLAVVGMRIALRPHQLPLPGDEVVDRDGDLTTLLL